MHLVTAQPVPSTEFIYLQKSLIGRSELNSTDVLGESKACGVYYSLAAGSLFVAKNLRPCVMTLHLPGHVSVHVARMSLNQG